MTSRTDLQLTDKLNSMTWSFSRVNSYHECPRMFYLQYVEKANQKENAFAQWGTLCHHIFEQYFNGDCALYEMTELYRELYDSSVTADWPFNKYSDLAKSYYERGLDVFNNYSGLPAELEFVASEQKILTSIGGRKFIGFIDLILRDRRDGGIIIQDFKSKSSFKNAAEQAHYAIQLYLYSQHIEEKYSSRPKLLRFDMFRAGSIVDIAFNDAEFESAKSWFTSTIDHIFQDTSFQDKVLLSYKAKGKKLSAYKFPDFFCANLCSCREFCKRSKV